MSYNREYYVSHKEKYLEATKRYITKKRAENNEEWLDKQNQYMKEYYAKNPDKREAKRKYDKEWRKKHPNYFKDYYKKRKQLKKEEKNED